MTAVADHGRLSALEFPVVFFLSLAAGAGQQRFVSPVCTSSGSRQGTGPSHARYVLVSQHLPESFQLTLPSSLE